MGGLQATVPGSPNTEEMLRCAGVGSSSKVHSKKLGSPHLRWGHSNQPPPTQFWSHHTLTLKLPVHPISWRNTLVTWSGLCGQLQPACPGYLSAELPTLPLLGYNKPLTSPHLLCWLVSFLGEIFIQQHVPALSVMT